MFIVGVGLIALGYTLIYYGRSMSQAFSLVHKYNLDPHTKGGIPLPVLFGITKGFIDTSSEGLGRGQSFPPVVTGTETHRPRGQ